MSKTLMSVVFVLALLVLGYFIDPTTQNLVNNMIGKGETSHRAESKWKEEAPQRAESQPSASESGTAKGTMNKIITKRVVNVGVQDPSPPFYFQKDGKNMGFNSDFIKILFAQSEFGGPNKDMSFNIVGVDTYAQIPNQLLKNDSRGQPLADIIIDGLTFSDGDQKGVVYTRPYITDFGYSLIVQNKSQIKTVGDLDGKIVGILAGDPDVRAYVERALPRSKIVELSDESDADGNRTWISNFINEKRVDAIVYDYPFGVDEIAGTNLKFALTKMDGSNIQYTIGIRDGDREFMAALNSAIVKAMETPEYSDMIRKYFMSNKIAKADGASGAETIYTVKQGDTLSKIAISVYGDVGRYPVIQSRNNLPNPNLISVGQQLVIPK